MYRAPTGAVFTCWLDRLPPQMTAELDVDADRGQRSLAAAVGETSAAVADEMNRSTNLKASDRAWRPAGTRLQIG